MHSGEKKFPKFHLLKCGTIESFIKTGRFDQNYIFAISRVNTVIDINTGYRYSKVQLSICKNCQQLLNNSIITQDYTSENFFDMEKEKFMTKKVRIDMNGYIFGWNKISKIYRLRKNFTCENCSVSPKEVKHQIYWDSHHIEGDKLKNDDKDLK